MAGRKSERELEAMLSEASIMVPPQSVWRHYKGGDYRVVCIAFDEDTLDFDVIYHPLHAPSIHFARPMTVWLETVEWKGGMLPRFEHLLST